MKSKEFLFDLLKDVAYPGFTRDIISFGIVKDLSVEDKKNIIQKGYENTLQHIQNYMDNTSNT